MKRIRISVVLEAEESIEDPRYSDDHDDSYVLIQIDNDTASETGDINKTDGSVQCAVGDVETGSYVL
jgi:hypothetical protein